MTYILMSKTVNFHRSLFTILFFMFHFRGIGANDPLGAQFSYKGKYTSDIKNYEIVVPQLVNKDGNFISHVVSHQHSKRSAKEMDFIFYKIPIAGKEYLIELTPNRKLISPAAVVETHKMEMGTQNFSNNSTNSTQQETQNIFKNLSVRKLKNTECHFSGYVKGENASKAALSTCYGLAGFIQVEKGFYTIEPVAEHDPFVEDAYPHILYKSDGLENNSVCQAMGEITTMMAEQVTRKRRENNFGSSAPLYIETLIVMDKSLIKYHKESDCENYVLTVFNMAFNLFHDASLGLMITLSIVRIVRLEVENADMNLNVNTDAVKTLEHFQTWQYEINPGDDSHPNHHDIAIFITRVDICNSPSSCGLLGLSTIGKACDPKQSAILCEDSGLRLGFIIAHEIGHLLGADHDEISSKYDGTSGSGAKTVMQPQVTLNSQTWSRNSQAHIKAFFKSGMGNCLLDEPEDHNFNVQDLLPGVMYDADFQCKHILMSDARECDRGSSCDSLNCYVPGYACIVTHTPPADGTRCGEGMWCHEGKCIGIGQRPGAIDGNWGEWSSWSDCTRTCGSGVASSVRQCDKPIPSHGGKNCIGERKRYKICATTPCKSGRPSFRDVQCGEFDDWIYPEDGKIHTWRAFYMHEDNPCTLFCINEDEKVAALRPRVVDGTMCYRGIRDICIGGTCKTLPCDLHFESNAIEDICGVCHGDGTGCEFSGGTQNLTKSTKGITKLIEVPSGSKNIKVEEMSATLAKIIVKDKETRDVYIKGQTLGMFTVPGSQAWLGMVKYNQEALNIPGPITKPLSIWIQRGENVTVKWSMALPPSQQRKPEFAWDFIKWGPCSAKCGPGTQKSEPSCMEEKSGQVENTFCADLEMPPVKVRQCEIAKCEPRWMVGDWKECEKPATSGKIRKRVVYCIKPIGEGEGESQIVPNSECPTPKPHDTEPCENRQKREDTEYKPPFFDDALFRSDTVEFGFHKKYDDYLTHFAALSGPQRNSETVPLHLLSSPHFKHYFRVLETPEDNSSDANANGDVNFSTNSTSDHGQNQNKLSPDFYKNTFSGNPIDVGHVQAQRISIKSRKNVQFESNKMSKDAKQTRRSKSNVKTGRNLMKFDESGEILGKFVRDQTGTLQTPEESNCPNDVPCDQPAKCCVLSNDKNEKENNGAAKKHSKFFPWFKAAKKKNRRSMHDLFTKKRNKIFNYSSPNLTYVINNLENVDSIVRNRFLHLIKGSDDEDVAHVSNECPPWNPRNTESVTDEASGSPDVFAKESNKCPSNHERNLEFEDKMKSMKKLRKDYDGSGLKKHNSSGHGVLQKISNENNFKKRTEPKKIQEVLSEKPFLGRKPYFSNPFDPTETSRGRMRWTKPKFKGGYKTIEDLFAEKKNRKLQTGTVKKRNVLILLNRHGADEVFCCGVEPTDVYPGRKIVKRLSHKWKKSKVKDGNGKSGKETGIIGYGTDTRNYLNNLFRDTRVKTTPRVEPELENEQTVIDTGRLVIDKDLADYQEVDIEAQDNHGEETDSGYKMLPQPSASGKVSLRGQDVFDFYKMLQRKNREKLKGEKIEIGVRIPSTHASTTESASTPPSKSVEDLEQDLMEDLSDVDEQPTTRANDLDLVVTVPNVPDTTSNVKLKINLKVDVKTTTAKPPSTECGKTDGNDLKKTETSDLAKSTNTEETTLSDEKPQTDDAAKTDVMDEEYDLEDECDTEDTTTTTTTTTAATVDKCRKKKKKKKGGKHRCDLVGTTDRKSETYVDGKTEVADEVAKEKEEPRGFAQIWRMFG